MMELDWEVGQILDKLDELGIAEDTIVLFTSDNGAEVFSWPDGGNHPFRGEKGSTYEGGFRVPMVAKWPGVIEPGTIVNEIMAHEDWLPTILAAAGAPETSKKSSSPDWRPVRRPSRSTSTATTSRRTSRARSTEGPRREFFYFSDNADLMAVRYNAWKLNFKTIVGNLFTGKEDSTNVPVVTNLRQDPWERYQTEGMLYGRWWGEKLWTMVPAINDRRVSSSRRSRSTRPVRPPARSASRRRSRCCKTEPSRTDVRLGTGNVHSPLRIRCCGR